MDVDPWGVILFSGDAWWSQDYRYTCTVCYTAENMEFLKNYSSSHGQCTKNLAHCQLSPHNSATEGRSRCGLEAIFPLMWRYMFIICTYKTFATCTVLGPTYWNFNTVLGPTYWNFNTVLGPTYWNFNTTLYYWNFSNLCLGPNLLIFQLCV